LPFGREETSTEVLAMPAAFTGTIAITFVPFLNVTEPVALGGPALDD